MNMIKSGQHAPQLFVPIPVFEGGFVLRSAFSRDSVDGATLSRVSPTDGKGQKSPGDEASRKFSTGEVEPPEWES